MSLLKLKCFFGFHKDCSKHYKYDHPNVHVFCKDSRKFIRTEHMEDHDASTVTFPKGESK